MRKRKQILFKIALLACASVVSLAAVELFLRGTVQRGMKVGTTHTPKADFYGWAPIPNSTHSWVNPDNSKKHTVRINTQGWKDVNHDFAKPEGIVRILFIGDSFTYGQVPLEALYTRKVQQKLIEREITNVEVISMGTGSWGTDQALEALKLEGIKYEPDVVIYQFCENDLENNLQPHEGMVVTRFNEISLRKPFRYTLREGRLEKIKIQTTDGETPPPLYRRLKDFLFKSEFIYRLNLIRGHIQSHFIVWLQNSGVWKGDYGKDNESREMVRSWTQYRIVPDGPYKPDDGSPHRLREWELFEALILEMHSLTSSVGAELAIFSVTGEEGERLWHLNHDHIQTDGSSDYIMWEGKKRLIDIKRSYKDLFKLCQRHSIPLVKITRIYERYKNDDHTNARGNEMMASDILDFLLSWDHFRRLVTLSPEGPPETPYAE